MAYIVMDLEWNQCPEGKNRQEKLLPFEIIEIGAVKLDDEMTIVDTFHEIISPQVYQRLHRMTRSVIALTDQDLEGHRLFPEVIRDFFSWCHGADGRDHRIRFCSWGSCDLTELQRNLAYYQVDSPFSFPLYYLDIQKIFSIVWENRKSRRSLEYAVDFLSLEKEELFHDAYSDALYTAKILQRLPKAMVEENFSVDYYRVPEDKSQELHLQFPTYSKDVFRIFPDRDAALGDREISSSVCCRCQKRCRKKIRWFPAGSHNYLSLAWCPEHGWLKGKLRIRSRIEGGVFVIKTQRLITDEEAEALRQKQEICRLKRKMHGAARASRSFRQG